MDKYWIIGRIYKYLHLVGEKLCIILNDILPKLSNNWWIDCVTSKLSYSQSIMVKNNEFTTLEELDLAILLRVTEKNWLGVSRHAHISNDKINIVESMSDVRNNWAHAPVAFPYIDYILADIEAIAEFFNEICDDGDISNEVRQFENSLQNSGVGPDGTTAKVSQGMSANLSQKLPFDEMKKGQPLKTGVSYGSNAAKMYVAGCTAFSWDSNESKKQSFVSTYEKRAPLHAAYATPEDFSVWFVCYSNISLDDAEFKKKKRKNYIYRDEIIEVDEDAQKAGINPFSEGPCRLVFVKIKPRDSHYSPKYGDYVYYGVFELGPFDYGPNGELTRKFTRVSKYDTYYGL